MNQNIQCRKQWVKTIGKFNRRNSGKVIKEINRNFMDLWIGVKTKTLQKIQK